MPYISRVYNRKFAFGKRESRFVQCAIVVWNHVFQLELFVCEVEDRQLVLRRVLVRTNIHLRAVVGHTKQKIR